MTKVFKYYAIRPMDKGMYFAVFGYDEPNDPTPPTHIEDFLSEDVVKAHYPTAVVSDLWSKPWPTPTGLERPEDA
ncbi:MAG: hypothetical protein M3P18_22715 [Actinomycetota bacterium]|nr:hypothetical protein [Actinomycetota bacterium]